MSVKTLLCVLTMAVLACTVSYNFIDRDVAFFVHENRLNQYQFLKWLTYIPDTFTYLAPVVLAVGVLQMTRRPLGRCEKVFFAASLSFVITAAFLSALKVVFGRYWPETWINNNPSLIQDGAYGFHFFHSGEAYSSFPSGHTARTVAVMSVIWLAYRKLRWFSVLVSGAVVVGLVGMNYHFVGDIIAGAVLGSIVGAFTSPVLLQPSSQHGSQHPCNVQ